MEERSHPTPFRTRQLSSPSPMILQSLLWESRSPPSLCKAPAPRHAPGAFDVVAPGNRVAAGAVRCGKLHDIPALMGALAAGDRLPPAQVTRGSRNARRRWRGGAVSRFFRTFQPPIVLWRCAGLSVTVHACKQAATHHGVLAVFAAGLVQRRIQLAAFFLRGVLREERQLFLFHVKA